MDPGTISRAQAGDRQAFEALIRSEHRRLFTLAHAVLRDPSLAEDATQQALVDIWRDLPELREPARFEAWSYRLLVRVCYREKRRAPDWRPDDDLAATEAPTIRDPYGGVVDCDRIERGFAQLSMDHRVVLAMRFLLDMTPDHIAHTLGIDRRTVYSRLKRAVPAMRAALEADDRPTPTITERKEAAR